jgi:hypothetical protein
MFHFASQRSPLEIEAVIEHLVGPEEAQRFWTRFRDTYVAEDDIRFIKQAGFNTIRVPLRWALLVDPKDHARLDGPGYALLDRLIGWCHEAGLKVILDLHAAPGGETGVNHDDGPGYPLVFYVPADLDLTIRLWRHLAERYKDEPAVLGYDVLNEPISPYHDENYLNPRLESVYRTLTQAIRSVDPNHVIFLEGAQWSTNFRVFGRPFAKNVAYTYHKFWANPDRSEVQSYVNFSIRYDVPVVIGETGEGTDDWNVMFRELNERFGIGWLFWTYKNMDSASTVVSVAKPADWEKIAAFGGLPPERWSSITAPSPAAAKAILDAYLDAIKFKNGHVNRGYLASLGLGAPN